MSWTSLLTFLAIAAIVLITLAFERKGTSSKHARNDGADTQRPIGTNDVPTETRPYRDKFQLLNKSEIELLNRLIEAVPALLIFSQVSMSQLFHIRGNTKHGFKQLGEIGKKSVDFLLCRREDTSIIAAIELNGPHHESEKQKMGDKKKKHALNQAGIPLIVIKPGEIPDVPTLRKMLAPHIVARRQYEAERDARLHR